VWNRVVIAGASAGSDTQARQPASPRCTGEASRTAFEFDDGFDGVNLAEEGDSAFERGDANADGTVDVSDGIFTLGYLFLGARTPGCLDALDTDDSGAVDLSDAVGLLDRLFLGDGTLPPPAACGPDPTPDDGLDCQHHAPCP